MKLYPTCFFLPGKIQIVVKKVSISLKPGETYSDQFERVALVAYLFGKVPHGSSASILCAQRHHLRFGLGWVHDMHSFANIMPIQEHSLHHCFSNYQFVSQYLVSICV